MAGTSLTDFSTRAPILNIRRVSCSRRSVRACSIYIQRRLFIEIVSFFIFFRYSLFLGKPENILLDREGQQPKLSDFGLARVMGSQIEGTISSNQQNMKTYCGTPHYFAPEMFKLQRQEVKGYGPEVDCWSLGVILYVLLSARPPFSDEDLAVQVEGGVYDFDCAEFSRVSESAKDLIRGCMQVDPEKRFTIGQILDHIWLKSGSDRMEGSLGSSVKSSQGNADRLSDSTIAKEDENVKPKGKRKLEETESRLAMPPPSSFKRVRN